MESSGNTADIAIVGGGIVGLAHAYMALLKGHRVVLFERDHFAVGASVRNFGLIWPIGQEPGIGLDRAMRSRTHWLRIAKEAGFWINPNGSLHVAYHDDEWDVLNEFDTIYNNTGYSKRLLSAAAVASKSEFVKREGLKGGLWSETECTVNPREAIRKIPQWLESKYGLITLFGHVVTHIDYPIIHTSRESWKVDKVIVCSGADFETLYPEVFDAQPVIKCKLQMMKAVSSINDLKIGPSLCAGLTLRHYAAFSKCASLAKLDERYDRMNPAFKKEGVHILLAQNDLGELIIGDSHHYGKTLEPFDREEVNELILEYLESFAQLGQLKITERWHGIYPKVPGQINMLVHPEPNVTVVNGLGGAGMTLSFGLAEEIIDQL